MFKRLKAKSPAAVAAKLACVWQYGRSSAKIKVLVPKLIIIIIIIIIGK